LATLNSILLGTSGWSYKEWIGPLYMKEDKSFLRAYTKVFKTVEIDSTFYRYPSKGTVMGWTRYSPEGFVYTAKLPKLITHEKKLDIAQGAEQELQKFADLMEPLVLGGKLGCILIQLPPSYIYKPKQLEQFFKVMPTHLKFAIEFRHPSWVRTETWKLLQKYKVAYTIVDEPLLPPEVHFTSDIAYFRWHGKGKGPWYDYRYKPEELEPWIPKVKEATANAKTVFGYFNNHYHGYAVENCLQVLEMLGSLTSRQAEAKAKVENHLKAASRLATVGLGSYVKQRKTDTEKLLLAFTDPGRLERAENISNSELDMMEETAHRVLATVRDYHVVIDIEGRVIRHDCEDWKKGIAAKRFCKHVAKLFLAMDSEKSMKLLEQIQGEKDEWQFEPYP